MISLGAKASHGARLRRLTSGDWRLFPSLVRFDPCYYVGYKCNLRRLTEYPNLSNYLRELYQTPGIAEVCDIDGMKRALTEPVDFICQMDADLSHPPLALPALLANVELGADLAIGSRYVPGGLTVNWPRRRQWLSRWGNRYSAGVLGLAINDATAGFRAYRVEALHRIDFETVRSNGYGFQVEMTYRALLQGFRVVEVPITFTDRTLGQSKMSRAIVVEAAVLVPRLRRRLS